MYSSMRRGQLSSCITIGANGALANFLRANFWYSRLELRANGADTENCQRTNVLTLYVLRKRRVPTCTIVLIKMPLQCAEEHVVVSAAERRRAAIPNR
eukprot:scaffold136981_cov25-Prasinocladus_malaysianus.AAC.1